MGPFINILAAVGGIVVVPVIVAVADCTICSYTNSPENLKNGVKTPILGINFTVSDED